MSNAEDQKHWPEPWGFHDFDESGSVIYSECIPIADTRTGYGLDWVGVNPLGKEGAKANARRIVSCVNACAGMADPEKEITSLREITEQAQRLSIELQEASSGSFANINDTCRIRGFEAGPSGRSTEDRVIAMAQAYDALREQNAVLQSQVDNADVNLEQVRLIERHKAKEQNAKLLDALKAASGHLDYIGYGDSYEREGADELREQIQEAISRSEPIAEGKPDDGRVACEFCGARINNEKSSLRSHRANSSKCKEARAAIALCEKGGQ